MNTYIDDKIHELNLAILDIKMFKNNKDSQAQNIVWSAKNKLNKFIELSGGHDCDKDGCITCELLFEIKQYLPSDDSFWNDVVKTQEELNEA